MLALSALFLSSLLAVPGSGSGGQSSPGIGSGGSSGPPRVSRAIPARHLVLVLLDDAPPLRPFADTTRLGDLDEAGAANDTTGLYPDTPVIDALAASGRRFTHCYSSPLCSPTRASILTGVYPFRHGVGRVVRHNLAGDLAEFGDPGYSWPTLPIQLGARCRSGFVGKLHLSLPSNEDVSTGAWVGRIGMGWGILDRLGFAFAATALRNLNQNDGVVTARGGFYFYGFQDDGGVPQVETLYATTRQVDEAIEFLSSLGGRRGFLFLSLNAAHAPWGAANFPPDGLVSTQVYLDHRDDLNAWPTYMAGTEAIDAELGRLMASIPPFVRQTTTWVVLSDNGPTEVGLGNGRDAYGMQLGASWDALVDQNRLKETPYRFGVLTPMIWSGPTPVGPRVDNPGTVSRALIDCVDLNETIREYFGAPTGGTDGISFLDLAWHGGVPGEEATHARQTSYSEAFSPLGDAAAASLHVRSLRARLTQTWSRSGLFQLVRRTDAGDELYQLEDELGTPVDPFETTPLDLTGAERDLYEELGRQLEGFEVIHAGSRPGS